MAIGTDFKKETRWIRTGFQKPANLPEIVSAVIFIAVAPSVVAIWLSFNTATTS